MKKLKLKRGTPPSMVEDKTGAENYIYEDQAGWSDKQLVFPGVSSCATIMCALKNKVTGMHVTVGTTVEEVKAIIHQLKAYNDTPAIKVYLLGPFAKWSSMKFATSADAIVKYAKAELGYSGKVFCYDQGSTADATYVAEFAGTEGLVLSFMDAKAAKKDSKGSITNLDTTKAIEPGKLVQK